MREQTPRVKVSVENGVTVVTLTDRKILDEISITQIGEQLYALVAEAKTPRLVLDFQSVSHMSSSALGMLITLHKRVREKKGEMRMCNIQPAIYEVFVITRLNEIFQISESKQDAIQSLA
ncbi:MAG TPA: anti-sigma factor antagonist [Phycisphaerales bacterium]|nr:anti-sigma factor antagonist [Phycisphaerales bacterium]